MGVLLNLGLFTFATVLLSFGLVYCLSQDFHEESLFLLNPVCRISLAIRDI